MPRKTVVLEGVYEAIENFLYSVGDAEDWLNMERPHFCDLIDAVADGKISAAEAKRQVNIAFANAGKQIEECRQLVSGNARRAGFSYLHSSLVLPESPAAPTPPAAMPLVRIVAPLPEGA